MKFKKRNRESEIQKGGGKAEERRNKENGIAKPS